MYLSKIKLTNIRSIDDLEITFDHGKEPGWHVILGDNGSGKSTVIRSIALGLSGPNGWYFFRQIGSKWVKKNRQGATIELWISDRESFPHPTKFVLPLDGQITVEQLVDLSQHLEPFFTSSFGVQRRFGNYNRSLSNLWSDVGNIAFHASALIEDGSLHRGLEWLQTLHVQKLEAEKLGIKKLQILERVIDLVNTSELFPNGERISEVMSEDVFLKDANENTISIHDMSDGFRSIASLLFELMAQMYAFFGEEKFLSYLNIENGTVDAPAIVSIDEVDAHLHPNWQKEIGVWFTKHFPKTQFIVSTHSPIVCRAAANGGSIWRLPAPGTGEKAYRVEGDELNRVLYGDILDAFSTDLFGEDVSRSEQGAKMLSRLARLNMKNARGKISAEEMAELSKLRATFPSSAPILSPMDKSSDVEAAE